MNLPKPPERKRILVAPLHWGLGHATRCIPIIRALIHENFEPILASDGGALDLLKKEFPKLKAIELPSYNVTYSKKGSFFKLKMVKDAPHILKTIKREKKVVKAIVESEGISGIISDNRFGVRHKDVHSIFMTHQLRVLSGNTTWLSSKMHQNIISKFDECWVPDVKGKPNLSGKLGHPKKQFKALKYIGPLSRFNRQQGIEKNDLLVLLSGPEPQRTLLEERLMKTLENFSGNICFVQGIIEAERRTHKHNNITVHNFMTSSELELAINESALVLSRSGYTTILDLATLKKKAFFIPTPGQFEQEYLAKKLAKDRIAPFCKQSDFTVDKLKLVEAYSGFSVLDFPLELRGLFNAFKGE